MDRSWEEGRSSYDYEVDEGNAIVENPPEIMIRTLLFVALIGIVVAFSGYALEAQARGANHVALETFQIPEVVPNTTLEVTEPVRGSSGTLLRNNDALKVIISTQDLPDGVHTFFWNLLHQDGERSILWAGNAIVSGGNGTANLVSTLPEGEENAPGVIFIGHGLQEGAAETVSVQLWVRTHGPPREDPVVLEAQLTTPFGGCTDTRNPSPTPEDYPCWNPQRAIFGED